MVHYCRDSRLGVRSGFFGGLGGVYGEEGGIYCFAAVGETHDSADGELHRGKQVWGEMLAVQQQEGISRLGSTLQLGCQGHPEKGGISFTRCTCYGDQLQSGAGLGNMKRSNWPQFQILTEYRLQHHWIVRGLLRTA